MTTLYVKDIHCKKCVARIENALNEANIDFMINFDEKTIEVSDDMVEKTISELDDLAFTAEIKK